jgi:hypothetical protein
MYLLLPAATRDRRAAQGIVLHCTYTGRGLLHCLRPRERACVSRVCSNGKTTAQQKNPPATLSVNT